MHPNSLGTVCLIRWKRLRSSPNHPADPTPSVRTMPVAAAGALWSLAANSPANQASVRDAGGICRLILLLEKSVPAWPEAARHAAGALRNLAADNPENKELIRRQGGILPLVRMLHAGASSLAAQQAAGALANLASNTTAEQDAIREASGIPPLIKLLMAGDGSAAAQHAAGALWNLGMLSAKTVWPSSGFSPLFPVRRG